MSFLVAQLLLVAAGLGVLGLLRLRTGIPVADLALAWFAGEAWFAMGAMALRFLADVPYSRWSAAAVCLAPALAWLLLRGRGAAPGRSPPAATRWLGRPAWIFAPLAAYVVVLTAAVALHGFNTPTHTDDGVRVRAFAPMLAFDDWWGREAAALLLQAGPVPTLVPSLAWRLTGRVDHFHVNYVVLATLLAFLTLAVARGAGRGAPERGWATAFGALSLPLLVYHCTSTYSDAVLAMHCGAGLLFHLDYSERGEREDAARALLLYLTAAMVKQEGEIVAGTCAAVLASQVAWNWRLGRRVLLRTMGAPLLGYGVVLAARVAAVGAKAAFPMLAQVAARSGDVGPGGSQAALRGKALGAFVEALLWSGNAGMLFWIFPAALVARASEVRRRGLAWPLVAVVALFAESAVSSVWLFPAYTLDGTTVHRALLAVSVAATVWLAALLVEPRPGRGSTEPGLVAGSAAAPEPPPGPAAGAGAA